MNFLRIYRPTGKPVVIMIGGRELFLPAHDLYIDPEQARPPIDRWNYGTIEEIGGECLFVELGMQTSFLPYLTQQSSMPNLPCVVEWWKSLASKEVRLLETSWVLQYSHLYIITYNHRVFHSSLDPLVENKEVREDILIGNIPRTYDLHVIYNGAFWYYPVS